MINENFVHQVRQNLYNNDQIQKLIPQLIGRKNPSDAYNEAQFKSVKTNGQSLKQAAKLNRQNLGENNNHTVLSQEKLIGSQLNIKDQEQQDSLNSSE